MVYFTDRNLGRRFGRVLRDAGLLVELHDDHFGERTSDEEWLRRVGQEGWVAITRDQRIRYKPNELNAVVEHGVAVLTLIGEASFPDLARSFVATSAKIEQFIAAGTPPYIAKVYRPSSKDLERNPDAVGRVERWYP